MNRTEKSHINSAAITHPGMTGKNNEDRYGVSAFTLSDEVDTPVLLAVLSDGIGGHRAGEVASEMVVDLISRQIASSDGKSPTRTLEKAIHYASQQIYSRSQADSGRKGMGATVACAWVIGQRLYTATVGDSRIYLIRQGRIHQISTDHSWIQEAIEGGILTPEQAVGHPNAHVIRRYVGSPSPPEVDFRLKLFGDENESQSYSNQGMILGNGDRLLLCSDGLTDLVSDDEILSITENHSLEESNKMLVDLANQRGGHDNITIIQLEMPGETFTEAKPEKAPAVPVKTLALGCMGIVLVAGLVIGLLFGLNWWRNRGQETEPAPQVEVQETTQPAEELDAPAPETSKPTHERVTNTPEPAVTTTPGVQTTSSEGNIPPPLEEADATSVPTDTRAPTFTFTPSPTETFTPTAE